MLAGVPCDFRLDYGRQIAPARRVIAVNRSRPSCVKNRRPTLVVTATRALPARLADGAAGERSRTPLVETLRGSEMRPRGGDRPAGRRPRRSTSIRLRSSARSTPCCRTTRFWWPMAATSSAPRPTPWRPAGRCRGSIPVSSARWASAAASPWAPSLPTRGGGVDSLRRRLGSLQPGRVRHLRAPRLPVIAVVGNDASLGADRARAGARCWATTSGRSCVGPTTTRGRGLWRSWSPVGRPFEHPRDLGGGAFPCRRGPAGVGQRPPGRERFSPRLSVDVTRP